MLAIQFLFLLSLNLLTEAKKPGGKPKYCKNPKGKYGESKCLDGEWQKCRKSKWMSTGKPCYSPYTMIDTDSASDPLVLQNTNCTSSTNLLTSFSPVKDENSCDKRCVQFGIDCTWWSFDKENSKCDLLADCNQPESELGVVSGQQGTISSYHYQVSKGGNQFLIKDCLMSNTTCILPNKTNVISSTFIHFPLPSGNLTISHWEWEHFNPVHICGKLCLEQKKPLCNAFTLELMTCSLLSDCSQPTVDESGGPLSEFTSAERSCLTYRKKYGIETGLCYYGNCCLPPYYYYECCPIFNLNCCQNVIPPPPLNLTIISGGPGTCCPFCLSNGGSH